MVNRISATNRIKLLQTHLSEVKQKMKTGKGLSIKMRAEIRENGTVRTQYFEFPSKGKFDRPSNVLYNLIEWFRTVFSDGTTAIDSTNLLVAMLRHDDEEKAKILKYIQEGARNGKLGVKPDANK